MSKNNITENLKLTPEELKKEMEKQFEKCRSEVANWKQKLDLATSQLKYWEMQVEAIRTVNARLLLDGWKNEHDKREDKK